LTAAESAAGFFYVSGFSLHAGLVGMTGVGPFALLHFPLQTD
jgi:hypothetical protein